MAEYLSPEWFAKAQEALADPAITSVVANYQEIANDFVIQQFLTDGPDWYVTFNAGAMTICEGVAPNANVTFTSDLETAKQIRNGELTAQEAFIEGRLRMGGSITDLVSHGELFVALDGALHSIESH